MKKVLLLMAILLGGVIAVRRLLPAEGRAGLSGVPAAMMGRMGRMGRMIKACMEHMPDEAPPKVMMSGMRRMQEQNEQLIVLLREQNDLLRERLHVEKTSSVESTSPRASRSKTEETGGVSSD